MMVGERVPLRRDRRRTSCHVRQISMYVCHVVLQISLTDIGYSFGRDRTTVSHACNVVEDRRDDQAFDDFIAALERVVTCFFGAPEDATMREAAERTRAPRTRILSASSALSSPMLRSGWSLARRA